jgi:DNA-binding PadR family transcriptional regulator
MFKYEGKFGRGRSDDGRHGGWGRRFARDGGMDLGEGGRHGRGGGFRRGGPRSRFFDTGDLRLVVLRMIAERPRHGYELIKEIEEKLSGAYSPSPGVIYPLLTMLEDMGYASVSTEAGGKKLYTVTAEGSAHLAEQKAAVDQIFARIDMAAQSQGGALPRVMRATHNLKMALRMRLRQGQLSEEQVRKIVSLLDDAAAEIERT